jgi:hypothetical protein
VALRGTDHLNAFLHQGQTWLSIEYWTKCQSEK